MNSVKSSFFALTIILLTTQVFGIDPSVREDACHPTEPGKLNVHMVAHTHDDVGWLKTVDQYYYGSNKRHAPFGVQYILDSVVSELLKNKNRRFVYAESAFLWRWWIDQDDVSKEMMLKLVADGQLEFVHGGWCMSDEATPHYLAMIDQMTFGLKFLNDTFGERGQPRVAWQIDPFGHSSEVALQFADMGYDGLFFGRIDHEDMDIRKQTKNMETIWRPDTSLGPAGDLFSGVLYNLYSAPDGFCFDSYCNDEPISDNPKLHGYNVDQRVQEFVQQVKQWSSAYKTQNVMITMGGDFNYIVASSWFKNIDKLIKYVNKMHPEMHVLYSTPACYLKALHEANETWSTKDNDDFFPYGSDGSSYWTGYFTSRPSLKLLTYRTNNLLQVCKQLRVHLGSELEEEQFIMQQAMGVAQHHDAVSGTEKAHVANDYALYLNEALDAGEKIVTATYRKWLGEHFPMQTFIRLGNMSMCHEMEKGNSHVITLYNPLAHSVSLPVRLPVPLAIYTVTGPSGEVKSELVPVPKQVLSMPGREGITTHELVFIAADLPPLALRSYHIEKNGTALPQLEPLLTPTAEDITVTNGVVELKFSGTSGRLIKVSKHGKSVRLEQEFLYYDSHSSGAYILRPTKDSPDPVSDSCTIAVHQGEVVVEVHQVCNSWVSQVIRLNKDSDVIEFIFLIGPVPTANWNGMEVISRYSTDIESNGQLFTDSNGRRMMQRIRNWRSSWNLTLTQAVASNFYPVTSTAFINDSNSRLTVITDRPQACASLMDGNLECLIHRRLISDDGKGVSEPLDETAFGTGLLVRGSHFVHLFENLTEDASKADESSSMPTQMTEESFSGQIEATDLHERLSALELTIPPGISIATTQYTAIEQTDKYNVEMVKESFGDQKEDTVRHRRLSSLELTFAPWMSIATTQYSASEWAKKYKMETISQLRDPLPHNVHLLTMERWSADSILIRLEHILQRGKPITIQLDMFEHFRIVSAVELNLSANRVKASIQRLQWRHDGDTPNHATAKQDFNETLQVTLQPMQIRTFRCYIEKLTLKK